MISTLKHRVAIDTMEHQAATTLGANEIGFVNLCLDRPLVCEAYRENRDLGSFILIDTLSHRTAAAGMIDFSLRRATDIRWQTLDVDKSVRVPSEAAAALRALADRTERRGQIVHRQPVG